MYLYTFALNVYPQLLLYRLIFSFGGAATSAMLTAVLADFVAGESTRGKLAGAVGLSTGLGAILALFGFLPLITKLGDGTQGLRRMYLVVASISVGFSVILGIFFPNLKPDDQNENIQEFNENTTNSETGLLPTVENNHIFCDTIDGNSNQSEVELKPTLIQKFQIFVKKSLQYSLEGIVAAKNPQILLVFF